MIAVTPRDAPHQSVAARVATRHAAASRRSPRRMSMPHTLQQAAAAAQRPPPDAATPAPALFRRAYAAACRHHLPRMSQPPQKRRCRSHITPPPPLSFRRALPTDVSMPASRFEDVTSADVQLYTACRLAKRRARGGNALSPGRRIAEKQRRGRPSNRTPPVGAFILPFRIHHMAQRLQLLRPPLHV